MSLTKLSESCRTVQGSKRTGRHIPSELRTEPFAVGCAGYARYRVIECRETGTRVVPQR